MRTERDLCEEEVRSKTPNPLTRRHLLSQVVGLYDPLGLVTPAKQKSAILVRKTFQEAGSGCLTRLTWDIESGEKLLICLRSMCNYRKLSSTEVLCLQVGEESLMESCFRMGVTKPMVKHKPRSGWSVS